MDLPSGVFNESYQQDMAMVRTRLQWFLVVLGMVVLAGIAVFLPMDWIVWLCLLGIYAVGVLGLQVITGLCGQFSMGHAAFMGVGAYTTGLLTSRYGLSPWLTLPLSALAAGLAGLLFATPAVRVKGFYLVMSTIAAQAIITWLPKQVSWTGGAYGMAVPGIPGIQSGGGDDYLHFWWLILAAVVICIFAAKNIQRTSAGRKFVAVRDNDLAAEIMGINLFRTKVLAFFIGSCFAGIAGWLYAHFYAWISPDSFSFLVSLWMLGMIIIGGMGSTAGAMFGVVLVRLLDKLVEYITPMLKDAFPDLSVQVPPAVSLLTFALVVAFFILVQPRGLSHIWERFKTKYRMFPFSQ